MQTHQERERPFLVYLDKETHLALKLKAVHDGESMRSIIRRLASNYVKGNLPTVDPQKQPQS